MKKFNTIHKTFILLVVALFSVFIITSDIRKDNKIAEAGNTQNMSGWAWADTIGWISFNSNNCKNDGVNFLGWDGDPLGCPTSTVPYFDYGVNIDVDTGVVSGYAWSENVGWISFASTTAHTPPADPYRTSFYPPDPKAIATFSTTTKKFSGWAKILSLNNDSIPPDESKDQGWIKLASSTGESISYAVELKNDGSGEFKGWAWNGNDVASSGIGWISFNHENPPSSVEHYAVSAFVPTKPLNFKVTTSSIDSCKKLRATWDDSVYEDGYYLNMDDQSPVPLDGSHRIKTLDKNITSADTDIILAPGTGYNFIVQAFNIFGYKASDQVQATTSPICQVDDNSSFTATGTCPKTITLNWAVPDKNISCVIDKYLVNRCTCTNGVNDCTNCDCGTDNCNAEISLYNVTGSTAGPVRTFVDSSFNLTIQEQKKAYRYTVSGHCASGYGGDWSLPSKAVVPCKTKPKFQEDKPAS
jgi:hypothetical protein